MAVQHRTLPVRWCQPHDTDADADAYTIATAALISNAVVAGLR